MAVAALALTSLLAVKTCPSYWDIANPATMRDFSFEQYASARWYEKYSRNFEAVTGGCLCTAYDVVPRPDGNYSDNFQCRRPTPESPVFALSLNLQPNHNPKEAGKAIETFELTGTVGSYWVLDHHNYEYAISYSCLQKNATVDAEEYIFFFSRYPDKFPFGLKLAWWTRLLFKGVAVWNMEEVSQTDCW